MLSHVAGPLTLPAAAAGATPAPDPRDRAARDLERLLALELERAPEAKPWKLKIEVATLPGSAFAVQVSGFAPPPVDHEGIRQFVLAHSAGHRLTVYTHRVLPGEPPAPEIVTRTERLSYLRDAAGLATVIDAVVNPDPTKRTVAIRAVGTDVLVFSGPKDKVSQAHRLLAPIDVPRPGVVLEMIGVQFSSSRPEELAKQLDVFRRELAVARHAMRSLVSLMRRRAADLVPGPGVTQLLEALGFTSLIAPAPESLLDVLIRYLCAGDPAAVRDDLDAVRTSLISNTAALRHAEENPAPERRPLGRFLLHFGLLWTPNGLAEVNDGSFERHLKVGRKRLLKFAFEYQDLVRRSAMFQPYYLQRSLEDLDPSLQGVVRDLALDLQDLFVAPAIREVGLKVRKARHVEFAQVGRASVATLSGVPTRLGARAVSAMEFLPPLTIGSMLERAKAIQPNVLGVPAGVPGPAGMPVTDLISLAAGLGRSEIVQELSSGVSIDIVPSVLRSTAAAELDLDLRITDPSAAGTRDSRLPPFSRVAQHEVRSRVYVKSLDLFEISAFTSQATVSGGRSYVPLLGDVWHGLFGELPFLGGLFSWRNPPKTKHHYSSLVVTSAISPTAMGVAWLYPLDTAKPGEILPYAALKAALGLGAEPKAGFDKSLDAELTAEKQQRSAR